MHFVFYRKHQHGCTNVSHCPYLGGAALSMLVDAADEQTEWFDSLLRQIDSLRAADIGHAAVSVAGVHVGEEASDDRAVCRAQRVRRAMKCCGRNSRVPRVPRPHASRTPEPITGATAGGNCPWNSSVARLWRPLNSLECLASAPCFPCTSASALSNRRWRWSRCSCCCCRYTRPRSCERPAPGR
jgi:hypothetical protein